MVVAKRPGRQRSNNCALSKDEANLEKAPEPAFDPETKGNCASHQVLAVSVRINCFDVEGHGHIFAVVL